MPRNLSQIVRAIIATVVIVAMIWRLPVNGWGSLAWLASIVAMVTIRAPFERETRKNIVSEKRAESTERILLILVALGGYVLPVIHLISGVFSFANYSLPNEIVATALIVLLFGLWLFWRSHADLGRNWSVTLEIREEHGLITSGVYQRIRHPMYSAIWLIFLTQPVFVQNWLAGMSGILAFGLMYSLRISQEELMMREKFGQAYDDYSKRTGRLWPRLKRSIF